MMSRIEQLISEIEEYIDSCRFQALSNSKIIVNKEELEELLVELRLRIPDEIKKYQKIISQQETILGEARSQADEMLEDAKRQADSMVAQASEQTSEMINEHEIMQRAYAHANEVVEQAQAQAQAIVDAAVNDANNIRQSSIQYTDDMLRSLQTIINHTMEGAKGRFDSFMSSMQSSYDIVSSNRNELAGGLVQPQEGQEQGQEPVPRNRGRTRERLTIVFCQMRSCVRPGFLPPRKKEYRKVRCGAVSTGHNAGWKVRHFLIRSLSERCRTSRRRQRTPR